VGGDGRGAGPAAVSESAFAVPESADRAGLRQTVLRDDVKRRVYADRQQMGRRLRGRRVGVLHDEHQFRRTGRWRRPREGG